MISPDNTQQLDKPASVEEIALSYSPEDVQQILHLAISRQQQGGELSRSQLVEIAEDMGISPENLQAAEQEWLSHQGDFQQRKVFDSYRRRNFQQNLIQYGIVNSFLLLLNLAASHELSWALYIAIAWGLGVALQAWKTFQPDAEEYEQAFQRWRVKKQLGQSFNTFVSKWLKPSGSEI